MEPHLPDGPLLQLLLLLLLQLLLQLLLPAPAGIHLRQVSA